MLQCLQRKGHLPSFFVPIPGDLTAQESTPPGIRHPRQKNANARGTAQGGWLDAAGIDWCIMIQWKPDCWSWKQKQKDKPITMHIPMLCEWFSSSASAYDPHNLVFTWDLWTPKYFWNIILLQGKKPMKLKNTKSKQLVWVLLLACPDLCFDWSY